MATKDKVEFYKYSQSEYDNITKSANALYFTTDTHRIYKGNDLYGEANSQSDWNINDSKNSVYIKNRPFYSEKIESDVWEFTIPITNESTGEGICVSIPMPDTDLSQFTNGQELEYEVYDSGELQSSGTNVFIKSVNVREMFEDGYITVDADVPNELMGMGEDVENVGIIFGITLEVTDIEQGIGVIHNTPNACFVEGTAYGGNENYTAQVKFKNFKNMIEHVTQIPDKYINWDAINWDDYLNNTKWKWEYRTSAMPFDTQPTIVTGNVNKLKADTFYFIKYTDTAETKFKLTYGEDILVDDTLEFNRNNAWNSSDNYKLIHCISVDTASNTAIFGKPHLNDGFISCSVPNNTKNLRIKISARVVNEDIKNSPYPIYSDIGSWGTGVIISVDENLITGNNYTTIGCYTKTEINKSDNSLTARETVIHGDGIGVTLNLSENPACIIDTTELSQIKHPRYEGLIQNDVSITVADDRRSYYMEGTLTGVCWEPINSVTFTNSFDLSSIKATYPIQCYSQLQSTDKKLFFKTNEANNKRTQLWISTGDTTLTGFSITVEGEIE